MELRIAAKRAFARLGYDVRTLSGELGKNAYVDIRRLTTAGERPVAADVGANTGQTVDHLRAFFKRPVVHSFEPGPTAFSTLERRMSGDADVHLNNCALGSQPGTVELNEHVASDMSSMLEIGSDGWGEVKARVPVEVRTLDEYCSEHEVERLDLLKSDTQGYDLEVLKGATGLLERRGIHLVLIEVNMTEIYAGAPRADEILAFTQDNGLYLVAFYNLIFGDERLRFADALFINPDYRAGT